MHREPDPLARRQLGSPAGGVGGEGEHLREPAGVERVDLRRLAVVPGTALDPHRRLVDLARRPDQLEEELAVVAAELLGELGDEDLLGEGARHVVHRAPPADAGVRQRLAVLAADRRDGEGQVGLAHPGLPGAEIAGVRRVAPSSPRRPDRATPPAPPIFPSLEGVGASGIYV
jgi:hypothetical protein